ncbi:hypothetical protein [Pseudomonas coleopterorum]|uniref:Uncharacterized protein n=1 Tax=Pseudomonas coleopterorum TaxID=1605838 RepID=A0AAJ6M3U4_9PSED|nr:hypothetical protein [Pseudomonas coleopterorum]WNC12084.1 hypothetical protein RI108_21865 [Pseudomonas coleopterorum]WNC12092.1 hypothetical protein RI108_21825 [Pseudomonas coleopterorum]
MIFVIGGSSSRCVTGCSKTVVTPELQTNFQRRLTDETPTTSLDVAATSNYLVTEDRIHRTDSHIAEAHLSG